MALKQSKSEKRLQRRIEKNLKEQNNNARLAQSIVIESKPIRITVVPDFDNLPRIAFQEFSYKDCALSWGITHADTEGAWSWGESRIWSDEEYLQDIESHFKSLVNNSWKEIESHTYNGKGKIRKLLNKSQPLDSIIEEAQNRWVEDETRAQFEELFRFRLGTDKRAWGIRVQHHFFLVWYERHHKICPPNKD